jgi:hypothetical protein
MKQASQRSLPWLSLLLLLTAYSTFSWFLYKSLDVTWVVWLLVLSLTLLEALLLTTLSKGLRLFVRSWLTSDVGYFASIIFMAMFVVFALVWVKVFSYVLVVVCAELLARLELQSAAFKRWQSFWILTGVSITGLALGLAADYWF